MDPVTIQGFIEARLAEDQEWAEGVKAAQDHAADNLVLFVRQWLPKGFGKQHNDPWPLPGDPRRVLRQVAALRAIMQLNREDIADSDRGASIQISEAVAAIWSDHPEYQPEWAP